MSESPDEKIIFHRNSGQPEIAFNLLVQNYQQKLYWHIRKIVIDHDDADDVLQNTFIKVWKNLENFREESGIFTWLFRIATNESLSLIRSNKRKISGVGDMEYEEKLANNLRSDPYFDGDAVQAKLQKAILALPEKQRIVFNMKYFDEMKYEQMAEILETSVGALKASYHHAVKKIERFMLTE